MNLHTKVTEDAIARVKKLTWLSEEIWVRELVDGSYPHEQILMLDEAHFDKSLPFMLSCADGRGRNRKISMAGAGILIDEARRHIVHRNLVNSGVILSGLYPHEDCGAEKLCIEGFKRAGATTEEAERLLVKNRNALAASLKINIIENAPMLQTHFHCERALVMICTDVFNVTKLPFNPFQINLRFYPEFGDAANEAKLLINIARGASGYGDAFSSMHPFVVFIIGSPMKDEYCYERVAKCLAPYLQEYGPSVVIRGLNVSKKLLGKPLFGSAVA